MKQPRSAPLLLTWVLTACAGEGQPGLRSQTLAASVAGTEGGVSGSGTFEPSTATGTGTGTTTGKGSSSGGQAVSTGTLNTGGGRSGTGGGATGLAAGGGDESGGGTNSGGASPSGSSGGTSVGAAGGDAGISPNQLTGSLAFPVVFAGEFYGSLPDGGPDLSNVDGRLSDGTDLAEGCDQFDGPPDGGGSGTRILDIYITDPSGQELAQGLAPVQPWGVPGDGGVFATIELTELAVDGGAKVIVATSGEVTYQTNAASISGQFGASFGLDERDAGSLSGSFAAAYCTGLFY